MQKQNITSSYSVYNELPAYHENYQPADLYNEIKNYNVTNCSSYKVQDIPPIQIDALTHGSKHGNQGYFTIIDSYGDDATNCSSAKTTENYHNSDREDEDDEPYYCIWDRLYNKWFDKSYVLDTDKSTGIGPVKEEHLPHLYKYVTFKLDNDHDRFNVYEYIQNV